MAAFSTPRPCWLLPLIGPLYLLLLLLLVGREARWGVVRAEEFDSEGTADHRESCFETVSAWSDSQLLKLSSLPRKPALDHLSLRDMLFFLHIPRTGGRTLHQCFLKYLFPSDDRCKQSYDQLRFNLSEPGCRLISTHDDYSLLDNLPLDMTSVVTSLRQPVDRVVSTYEFSVEVAARLLQKLPNPVGTSPMINRTLMNTTDIWPWKHLVRTMEKDLFGRQVAREREGIQMHATAVSVDDSYDAALIAMPLREFVNQPVAHEQVHNGATYQVAGLTSASYSENAEAIRQCVVRFPSLGELVLEVAKKRLDGMLYVGLTDRQDESAVFLAKVLRDQIPLEGLMRSLMERAKRSPLSVPNAPNLRSNFTSLDEFTEEELTEQLMVSYGHCVGDHRRVQEARKAASLEMIKPIKFSREKRKLIPYDVLEKVSALNTLDVELYAHAEVLFEQQQKFLEFGSFHFVEDDDHIAKVSETSSFLEYGLSIS